MAEIKEEFASRIEEAKGGNVVREDQIQLIVFKLGTEEYGLHIDQIKEVVLTPNVTGMPETGGHIKGVANIRGNIISIIDLEQRFGISESNGSIGKYTLVVASEEFKIGILVKDVPNTMAITESNIENMNGMFDSEGIDSNYIKGVVKVDDRLIIMIDIYKVMKKQELNAA